ncbi:mRNA turnover protein 4-like protein [Camponotus floridanus]|uniref:Ribosome assembly factor mrt4 n=1 Tax=Camponotus floridanus TaxID=104421 RepID=E2A3I2_CAMFO|nr:mRNA turnover protein 4 homolog [Camponotus floridanus]EFN72046.1 mRNA turnover protein 4-like protein [Camponotus floridanus]
MPKSKRDKKVSLTKTNKKGLVLKQRIIEDVKKCVEDYNRIFLISVQNTRNTKLLELRTEWNDSRLFFGKLRIIALGLGKTRETEVADGIHKLANAIKNHSMKGQCGLLFTNRSKKEVIEWAEKYEEMEYARSGFVTPETIELPEGPLPQFQHSMEPQLRQLGMPTSLQKGIITLIKPFRVCQKNDVLTPEQAQILKLLDKPLAVFKLLLLGIYTKKHGFKKLKVPDNATKNDGEEMDVDNNDNT